MGCLVYLLKLPEIDLFDLCPVKVKFVEHIHDSGELAAGL